MLVVILVVERLRQEDCLEFADSLDPIVNYRLFGDSVSKKGKEKKKTSPESKERSCPHPSTDEHWLHPQPNAEVQRRRGGAVPTGVGAGGRQRGCCWVRVLVVGSKGQSSLGSETQGRVWEETRLSQPLSKDN